MAPELIRRNLLDKVAHEKQRIAYEIQETAEDDALIEADNRRKAKRLKILLPLTLVGLIVVFLIMDPQPPCTPNPEDHSILGELAYLGRDRPTRESTIQAGGWICGEPEPQYTFSYYAGGAISLVFLALGALAYSLFYSPENVREAKSRKTKRLFKGSKGGGQPHGLP